jgi:hypothetical protein
MNAKSILLISASALCAGYCGQAPAAPGASEATYMNARADSVWSFVIGEIPAGQESFWSDYRSVAWFSIRHEARNGVNCIFTDNDAMSFGVPEVVQEGYRFACGTSTFEVLECYSQVNCVSSLIRGEWRTGTEPEFRNVPVRYIYNKCLGILSISLFDALNEPESFGSALELRNGSGLLANPQHEDCQ